jgi:hypothetical protein
MVNGAALDLEPVPFTADSLVSRDWLRASGWLPVGSDSINVSWRNGLYGPVFRLAVTDSLSHPSGA